MFPVIMYDGNSSLPKDESIYYIVARGGIYLYKDLKTVKSLTKVDSISFLKELKGFAELKIPLIPKEIITTSVGYFRYIYQQCNSEGGLILNFYPETERYELHCPSQKVSPGSVDWNNEKEPIPQDAIRIGSIHSHGSGMAFHSSTDKEDEKNFDGLHITIGHMNNNVHSIVVSIAVNGNRFKLNEKQISEYIDIDVIPIENNPESKKWESCVSTSKYIDSDERKFTLESSDCIFPNEWKNKFEYKAPKIYRWDTNSKQLIETDDYDKYMRRYYEKEYDWSKWGNVNNNVPKYPLMQKSNCFKNDEINKFDFDPCQDCFNCMYKLFIEDMLDQGIIELSELKEYMGFDGSRLPIGMDELLDEEYYNKHLKDQNDTKKYDLHYDEEGNMVDSKDNVIVVTPKDEEDHINEILSSKDYIDHK